MTVLTKAEITLKLTQQLGLTLQEAKQLVELFFATISQTLIAGEATHLSGFGNFILCDKSKRPGRNPKTGEAALIKARRVVVFHAGQKLRRFIESPVPIDHSPVRL